jgi:hypothetical protein
MADDSLTQGTSDNSTKSKKSVHSPFVKRVRELQSRIMLRDMEKQTASITLKYQVKTANRDILHDELEKIMDKQGIANKPTKERNWKKKKETPNKKNKTRKKTKKTVAKKKRKKD